MKKLLAVFFLVLSLNASAQVFFQAQCQVVNRATARCTFCNYNISPRAMFCRMDVQGQTYYGAFWTGFVQNWVAPGQCIYGFVNAQNPVIDPLTRAHASVRCQ